MIRPLTHMYREAILTLDQYDASNVITREQVRHAVQTFDPYQTTTTLAFDQLLMHELRHACHDVQEQGLSLQDTQTELLVLSAFQSDAGYLPEEIQEMSPAAIKRHLSSIDASFTRLLRQLFLHQSQPDILCQRFLTIFAGAVASKCHTCAKRLKEATLVLP